MPESTPDRQEYFDEKFLAEASQELSAADMREKVTADIVTKSGLNIRIKAGRNMIEKARLADDIEQYRKEIGRIVAEILLILK